MTFLISRIVYVALEVAVRYTCNRATLLWLSVHGYNGRRGSRACSVRPLIQQLSSIGEFIRCRGRLSTGVYQPMTVFQLEGIERSYQIMPNDVPFLYMMFDTFQFFKFRLPLCYWPTRRMVCYCCFRGSQTTSQLLHIVLISLFRVGVYPAPSFIFHLLVFVVVPVFELVFSVIVVRRPILEDRSSSRVGAFGYRLLEAVVWPMIRIVGVCAHRVRLFCHCGFSLITTLVTVYYLWHPS